MTSEGPSPRILRVQRIVYGVILLSLCVLVIRLVFRSEHVEPNEMLVGGVNAIGVYEVTAAMHGCEPEPIEAGGFRLITWNGGNGPVVSHCEDSQSCQAALLGPTPGVFLPTPPLQLGSESNAGQWTGALRIPTYLRAEGDVWMGKSRHMVCLEGRCVTLERGSQVHREGDVVVVVTTLLHADLPLEASESNDWRTAPLVCVAREEVRLTAMVATESR